MTKIIWYRELRVAKSQLKRNTTFLLTISILTLFAASFSSTDKLREYNSDLNHMQSELKQVENEQQSVIKIVNNFQQDTEKQIKDEISGMVKASWYDYKLDGINWSLNHRTAASRDFPRGTMLNVCNPQNQKCVDVLVNDFGPDKSVFPDRGIDLSSYAFSQISNLNQGVTNVTVRKIQ